MKTWLIRLAVAALLALTFAAYLQPGFTFDLANRFFLCN